MEPNEKIADSVTPEKILAQYSSTHPSHIYSHPLNSRMQTKEPVAFQELFIPIANMTSSMLIEAQTLRNSGVADKNPVMQENPPLESLVATLSLVASKVLEKEFSIYRSVYSSALDTFLNGASATELYTSFIKRMYAGGFVSLLIEYPEMCRLFATVSNQWLASVDELMNRLEADIGEICRKFNDGRQAGSMADIKLGISDRHNGGRTAVLLTFSSGLKLVYKPRSLGMEEAWFKLLARMNKKLSSNCFKIIKVLDKGAYGWMEYVPHLPCMDEHEIQLYYYRTGALLAMTHLLKATDCHCQNLIASGAYPVLIDLETLFHPYTKELNISDVQNTKDQMEKYHSVLRTGLLPGQGHMQSGAVFDASGLCGGIQGYPKRLKWLHPNTDGMRQEYVEEKSNLPPNLPFIKSRIFEAKDHVIQITKGFEKTYSILLKAPDNPKMHFGISDLFKFCPGRVVFRSTQCYNNIITDSLEIRYLKDPDARRAFIDALDNIYFDPRLESCFEKEKCSLYDMDIPYFNTHDIPEAFVDRSVAPGNDGMRRQIAHIKAALA